MFAWDSQDAHDRFAATMAECLIPFLCERTGYSREMIARVLDAQNEFWRMQSQHYGLRAIWEWMREEDDDAG